MYLTYMYTLCETCASGSRASRHCVTLNYGRVLLAVGTTQGYLSCACTAVFTVQLALRSRSTAFVIRDTGSAPYSMASAVRCVLHARYYLIYWMLPYMLLYQDPTGP